MKKLILISLSLIIISNAFSQEKRLKGDGQIFWEEHFDWATPGEGLNWKLPDGWKIEDNSTDDNGYVWAWSKDSLKGPFSKRDGGYILNSTTGDNGFLAIDLDNLNSIYGNNYMEMKYVNSTITLPDIDCRDHQSVIIGLEQMFKYMNSPRMLIEVSNDNGAHWAEFDMKMGSKSGANVMNLPNDEVAFYTANLSDVAGGQANVTIKITWEGSMLYFWMLDDIILFEGWDYDLKMDYWQTEVEDDRFVESAGFYYMMPKTQIMPIGKFEASVINYGEYEMSDIKFNVEINKNHIQQFNAYSESIPYMYFGEAADTLVIEESYTPVDYGHYDISFRMIANEEDQALSNNEKSYFFHITDSVFARTPDVSEVDESPWRNLYQYTHEGDIMGVEFNPIEDCIASSISVYISRSNLDVDFKFILMEIKEGEEDGLDIVEILASETRWVDQEVIANGWLTLPLEHDGIGEFLKAGNRYMAAVQFWTYIEEDDLKNRGDAFYVGATQSYPSSYDKQWLYESYTGLWTQGSANSKMIRLNIDNHENIIDGIQKTSNLNSLQQNFPNPFSKLTQIDYSLVRDEYVSIEIKDISGRIIDILNEGTKPAGKHSVVFSRNGLEAGLYFYTLKAGENQTTKRMTIQ